MTESIDLSFSPGPASNLNLEPWRGRLAELSELLSAAEVGPKDGAYFVRGPFREGKAARADANIERGCIVILDGDSRIDTETGEVFPGAPAPHLAHEALVDAGIRHVIYTSHSHLKEPGVFKWRAVIPADLPSREALAACVDHVIGELHKRHVMLAPAKENYAWSQAWFLPRKRSEDAEFLPFDHLDGEPLDVPAIVAEYRANAEQEEVQAKPCPQPAPRTPSDGTTPIDWFLTNHGDDANVLDLLDKHGYILCGTTAINGQIGYKLLAPGSGSERPGVRVYQGETDGRWLVWSHHGEHDPLADGKVHDAFDAYAILEHGGGQKAAAGAVRMMMPRVEPGTQSSPLRYRLLDDDDMARLPPTQWRIKGILPATGLGVIYGPSGTGKSFLVLDMCAAIARGLPDWFGFRIKQAPVVYCALEGESGMAQRVNAYRQRHEAGTGVKFVLQPYDLRDVSHRNALCAAIRATRMDAPVVVLDTLSRASPGADENSSMDMGEIISGAAAIKEELGGLVLLVHHTGKDSSRGMRGHSSLVAAIDAAIETTAGDGKALSWAAIKTKDGALPEPQGYALDVTELGTDEDGDTITSCVIARTGYIPPSRPAKLLEGAARDALVSLVEAWSTGGVPAPVFIPANDLPPERKVVALSKWRDRFYQTHGNAPTADKRKPFQRARASLAKRKAFGESSEWVWPSYATADEPSRAVIDSAGFAIQDTGTCGT